jgi:MFS family permease
MAAPPRASLHFALIFVAHALGAMSLLSVLTAGPQLVAALGLSPLQLGGLASLYSGALAAASLPAGLVTDRLGTRGALTLSAFVIATGLVLCAAAGGFAQLGAGIALCGAGYGLINPAAGRAITLWFTPKWRTTLLSLKQTGVPAGAALGSLTALLGPTFGWQAGILCAAVIALVSGLMFALFLPTETPQPSPDTHRKNRLTEVLALPGLARANVVAGLTNGIQFALWAHLPALLVLSFGNGAALLGLCLAALHLGTFLGRVVWGALTDRLLQGNAARGLWLLCVIALVGVAALGAIALVASPVLAVIACFILGFTACAAVGLHVALTALITPDHLLGGAMGYTMLFTNLGGIVVPVLLGIALSLAGVGGAALSLAALLGLALVLLHRFP